MNTTQQQPVSIKKQDEFMRKSYQTKIIQDPRNLNVWSYEFHWRKGLCETCKISKKCCCAYWCYWCFVCELQQRTNECFCTPVFAPGAMLGLRAKIRTGFRIEGSLFDDFLITTFFPCCSALQMHEELDFQGL